MHNITSLSQSSFCSALLSYFETGSFTDLAFVCKDSRVIRAHKVVLCAVSPFLRRLFAQREEHKATVMVPDIEFGTMTLVMSMLYGGGVTLTGQDDVCKIKTVLEILGIQLSKSNPNQSDTASTSDATDSGTVVIKTEPEELVVNMARGAVDEDLSDSSGPCSSDTGDNSSSMNVGELEQEVNRAADTPKTSVTLPVSTWNINDHLLPPQHHLAAPPDPPDAPNKPYSCQVCGRRWRFRSELVRHMQFHTDDKPFSCDVCQKKFFLSSNLTVHARTHSGAQPFVCVHCGRGFTTKGHLDTHGRTHTGARPYSCQACGRAFRQKQHLDRHVRAHRGDRPHQCLECGKRFGQSWHLRKHLSSTHPELGQESTAEQSGQDRQREGADAMVAVPGQAIMDTAPVEDELSEPH